VRRAQALFPAADAAPTGHLRVRPRHCRYHWNDEGGSGHRIPGAAELTQEVEAFLRTSTRSGRTSRWGGSSRSPCTAPIHLFRAL